MADLTGTSTITKFGVPLGDDSGRGGQVQPKYTWRFRVRFINFGPINGGADLTQLVETVGRPHFSQSRVSVPAYNSVSYFTERGEWQPIDMTLKDDVSNLAQTAFEAGINYKFTMYIDTLQGDNDTVLDSWFLEGCFITDFNENGFSYVEGNSYMKINLTISYDNATLLGGLMTDTPDSISGLLV